MLDEARPEVVRSPLETEILPMRFVRACLLLYEMPEWYPTSVGTKIRAPGRTTIPQSIGLGASFPMVYGVILIL